MSRSRWWPTSGPFGAGPLHGGPSVGLGPVDGSPPGLLAGAPGCWRQLWNSWLSCARATAVLKRIPPVPWIGPCHRGVTIALSGGRSGGENGGGLWHGRGEGEIFNGRPLSERRRKLLELRVVRVLVLNSRSVFRYGETATTLTPVACYLLRGQLLVIIPGKEKLHAAFTCSFTSFLLFSCTEPRQSCQCKAPSVSLYS